MPDPAQPSHRFLHHRLEDLIRRAEKQGSPVVTDFLVPFEQEEAARYLSARTPYCPIPADPESVRRCFAIPYDDGQVVTMESPLPERISQRDLFGALMALGIARERIGDVWLEEGMAYLTTMRSLSDDIAASLKSAGNCPLQFRLHEGVKAPVYRYTDRYASVSSMRLDAVVRCCAGVSRQEAARLIRTGMAVHNYREKSAPDDLVRPGDILSIRGSGRYRIARETRTTRSGRTGITIRKFV